MGSYSFFLGAVAIALGLWVLKKAIKWAVVVALVVSVPVVISLIFGQ